MSFYYLSNPYNGTQEKMEERADYAAKACGRLIKDRVFTLSPIVHNHAMLKVCEEFTLEQRREIILDFDFSLLSKSKGMIVLKLDGWEESYGVSAEIKFCNDNEIPVHFFTYAQVDSGEATSVLKQ